MNPQAQFCPNPDCPASGKIQEGNITVHSKQEKRYRCLKCKKTFSDTYGTALYRLKKEYDLLYTVTILLSYGCPIQAVVAAFHLDERTVAAWLARVGEHSQKVHEQVVGNSTLDLEQVQADEIKVRLQGASVWLGQAIMVRTRLWLGGEVSESRDRAFLDRLVARVKRVALKLKLLVSTDGLGGYPNSFKRAFRETEHTGKRGRPRLIPWSELAIVQVIKRKLDGKLDIQRRQVQGEAEQVQALLLKSQRKEQSVINTAYIERLNGTFRQRLACLARRSRAALRTPERLVRGMFLLGAVYNFCTPHHSLRVALVEPVRGRKYAPQTPAMAAGLTKHVWTVEELLCFKIPPSPAAAPVCRGRPPKVREGVAT